MPTASMAASPTSTTGPDPPDYAQTAGCLNQEKRTEKGRGSGPQKYPKMNKADWVRYSNYYKQKKYYFNITEQEIRDLMDSQSGCCGICDRSLDHIENETFHIDHNHSTGRVRGLLCSKCNKGLGSFEDNQYSLGKAIKYLEVNND